MRRAKTWMLILSILAGYSALADEPNAYNDADIPATPEYGNNQQPGTAGDFTPQNNNQQAGTADRFNQQPGTVDNYDQQPGTASDLSNTSVTEQKAPEHGGDLRNEVVGIKPQVGIMNLKDASGNYSNRGAIGLTFDWNLVATTQRNLSLNDPVRNLYIGPSFGFIYSHIGSPSGNWIGTNNAESPYSGANMFMVPIDGKIGWNLQNVRLAVHGGGNLIYRSIGSSVQLGTTGDSTFGSDWVMQPNIGADLEIGSKVALIVRPDWTLNGSERVFTGTVGLSLPIG